MDITVDYSKYTNQTANAYGTSSSLSIPIPETEAGRYQYVVAILDEEAVGTALQDAVTMQLRTNLTSVDALLDPLSATSIAEVHADIWSVADRIKKCGTRKSGTRMIDVREVPNTRFGNLQVH